MPGNPQAIAETTPKTGSVQYGTRRISGLPLIIPSTLSPLPATVPVGRIVSIQENANKQQFAVLGHQPYEPDEYETYVVIGYGVIEEALQSGIGASAAPTANEFANGDPITVITGAGLICAVEYEASHAPTPGIAVTNNTVDNFGRLTDRTAAADYKQTTGAVSLGVPSLQLKNQLRPNMVNYQFVPPLSI